MERTTRLVGVHVPRGRTIDRAVGHALALGCETFQVFSRNPRSWHRKPLTDDEIQRFHQRLEESGLGPAVVHVPYLSNLASPEPLVLERSREATAFDYREAVRLGAHYFVMHPGSVKDGDPRRGQAQVARELTRLLAEVPGSTKILLENTAGTGRSLGARLEELRDLLEQIQPPGRVGVCLDTAHLFAAGYELRTASGWRETLEAVRATLGTQRIRLIHLNDSKVPCGSRRDRHEHLGRGQIGLVGLRRVVRSPAFRPCPLILETPKRREADDRRNLRVARRLIGGHEKSGGGVTAKVSSQPD